MLSSFFTPLALIMGLFTAPQVAVNCTVTQATPGGPITITCPTPSPTLTPTIKPSASPSPSASPTSSPSPTASPTHSPTPTPTASATAARLRQVQHHRRALPQAPSLAQRHSPTTLRRPALMASATRTVYILSTCEADDLAWPIGSNQWVNTAAGYQQRLH